MVTQSKELSRCLRGRVRGRGVRARPVEEGFLLGASQPQQGEKGFPLRWLFRVGQSPSGMKSMSMCRTAEVDYKDKSR